jgi:hypothetical protein
MELTGVRWGRNRAWYCGGRTDGIPLLCCACFIFNFNFQFSIFNVQFKFGKGEIERDEYIGLW